MAERRRTPPIFTVLSLLLLVVPLAVVGWWLSRPEAPRNTGPVMDEFDVVCMGRVDVPGMLISLEPSMAGRVVEISDKIGEGRPVKKGDFILKVDDSAAVSRRTAAAAAVELADVSVRQAELDADRFPKQIAAKKILLSATAARLASARKGLEQRKLQSAVTPIGKAEMEAMESQVTEMELLESAEQAQVADMQRINPLLAVQAAKARKSAAQADWELADKAVQDCVLNAPADGRILRMQATVGGMLMPGGYSPAVVFAPTSGGMVVRAEIDQEFLGRVKEGQKADIQDENRIDAANYTGTVQRLSRWVAQKRSMILDPGELNDVRTVECLVVFDTPPGDLFIGQRMRVRIRAK
jgi:multidrug resistance efflux pump